MSQYFPKPFRNFGGNNNVKVDLSNYATKNDLKNITRIDSSCFAEVDKVDIDKLERVPVDLSKLSDVKKNDADKKTVYEKLAAKVNNIDTSDFVFKNKYQTDKTELEKKIPDVSSSATKTAFTAVENKISSVSSLVKKNKL